MPDSETLAHIEAVRDKLAQVVAELMLRAQEHDASKLQSPERDEFRAASARLSALTYGSAEYEANKALLKDALEHHYRHNRHHPEHEATRERWLPAEGYPNYEISDLGRIRNQKGQILKPHLTAKGYQRIQLTVNGNRSNRLVHSLVAEAFVLGRADGLQVHHKDGDKQNNRASNLAWVTQSENIKHAYDTGLKKPQAKYIVTCDELGIVTVGCNKMAAELKSRGYNARSEGVWLAAVGDNMTHCGLHLTAERIEEPRPYSGVAAMTLIDLVEMFCDWAAASERHADGNLLRSIEIGQERFGFSDELVSIFRNTALELGWTEEP